MPELPEVETIKRQLNKVLAGRKIVRLDILDPKRVKIDRRKLKGLKIKSLSRRAKIILIELEKKQVLIVHLKMTGQLIHESSRLKIAGGHPTGDWYKKLPVKSTRLIITFDDGSKLFFNDQRGFGWVEQIDKSQIENRLKNFSPIDPTSSKFDPDYLAKICQKTKRPIKLVIMDQSKIGGIGNIYANDGLWLAKIHPLRPANSLSKAEIGRLYQALIDIINEGLKYNGASVDTYVDSQGQSGNYQQRFKVYSRAGRKCLRNDGGRIQTLKVGGRRTFFCPVCQK